MAKLMPKKATSQPTFVCATCGKQHGVWYRLDETTRQNLMGVGWYEGIKMSPPTWVTARCGVCQEVRAVVPPETYGGLVQYWQPCFAFD